MSEKSSTSDVKQTVAIPEGTQTLVVDLRQRSRWPWILAAGLAALLAASVFANVVLMAVNTASLAEADDAPPLVHVDGEEGADTKLLLLEIKGTISPPNTAKWLAQIDHAIENDSVKGVLLYVDSPGGLVADSHQIYYRLKKLSAEKPVVTSFGRLAASGGYYVAMGAGPEAPIYAEPTTWTGSIGVIVPYYNVQELAEKVGFDASPLKTGEFKDALSPFKPLTPEEEAVWDALIADAFDRFKGVIAEGRPGMTAAEIDEAATGQVFTTEQAIERGLVDELGFREDVIAALRKRVGADTADLVKYQSPPTMLDLVLDSVEMPDVERPSGSAGSPAELMLRLARPEAYYLFGWPSTMLPR